MTTQAQRKERALPLAQRWILPTLEGRKTQLRIPISIQPLDILTKKGSWDLSVTRVRDGFRYWFFKHQDEPPRGGMMRCKWGEVGDLLWVRETWHWDEVGTDVSYRADYDERMQREAFGDVGEKWRPSIHMPKWACRLWLEVTEVRVERVTDISEADALADGGWTYATCPYHKAPVKSFAAAWDEQYGATEYAWANRPWVWAISFQPTEQR